MQPDTIADKFCRLVLKIAPASNQRTGKTTKEQDEKDAGDKGRESAFVRIQMITGSTQVYYPMLRKQQNQDRWLKETENRGGLAVEYAAKELKNKITNNVLRDWGYHLEGSVNHVLEDCGSPELTKIQKEVYEKYLQYAYMAVVMICDLE